MKKKKIIALIIFILLLIVGSSIYILLNNKNSSKDKEIENRNINISKADDDLIFIKGGSFKMGSPENEVQREKDETLHEVTVNNFYVSAYEITQDEYETVMGINPSNFKGQKLPVENVTWYEAIEYCNKLSEKNNLTPVYKIDGKKVTWDRSANGYRLLTEAEWEYVARAGTTTPFNTETSISAEESNFYGHYPYGIEENYFSQGKLETKPGEYRQTTVEVNSFKPNKWGLYNIHGNVREWVYDYYTEYDLKKTDNPAGPATGTLKVTRGGGWNDYAKHMRSAFRSTLAPDKKMNNTGFRIARNSNDNNLSSITSENESRNISRDKVLIVYFSWSGNTKNAAKLIKEKTGADIFEIELEKPYSSDYNTVLDQAQKDMNKNARPKIKNKINNIDDYDVILLGYPNWWATIPMPIASFLDDYKLDNKLIIPFCSHGGGEFGQSIADISKIEPNAVIGTGLSIHYSGGSGLSKDIDEWLIKNGIK